jgi:HPt (histidine-containing phosphotransfer) domain-containing protein
MAKDKGIEVKTYATHHVITQPNPLRKVLRRVIAEKDLDDPVARAEEALAGLSGEFNDWMRVEADRLSAAYAAILKDGFSIKASEELFRSAHDIKGQCGTLGFPEVAGVAESLCRLIEHIPEGKNIPIQLIDQHVDAVRAIIREHARPDVAEVAGALTKRLREVTDDLLKRENRDRPEILERIFSPSIAPGSAGT